MRANIDRKFWIPFSDFKMKRAIVIYLEFDCVTGPVVVSSSGSLELDDSEMQQIKNIAFPESATKLPAASHIFATRIGDAFCYCLYVSKPDPNAARGYHQYSFVVATHYPYFPIFKKLLQSAADYYGKSTVDVYEILCNLVFYWHSLLCYQENMEIELPLFEGSIFLHRSSEINNGIKRIKSKDFQENFYMNLKHVLDIKTGERFDEVVKLWEYCFIDEPILVIGSTPAKASTASLAIASLAYPEAVCNVIPYIPITDSRISINKGIIGCSNPIAPALSKCKHIFRVGFADDMKHMIPNCKYPVFLNAPTNDQIRMMINENTKKLVNAVESTLSEMIETNFVEFCLGQVNQKILEKHIKSNRVKLTLPIEYFTERLLYSKFFSRKRKDLLTDRKSVV